MHDNIEESVVNTINTGIITTLGTFFLGNWKRNGSTDFEKDVRLDETTINDHNSRRLVYIVQYFTYKFTTESNSTSGSIRIKVSIDGNKEFTVDNISV